MWTSPTTKELRRGRRRAARRHIVLSRRASASLKRATFKPGDARGWLMVPCFTPVGERSYMQPFQLRLGVQ